MRKSKDWLAWNQNNVLLVERHVYPQTVVSVSYHYKKFNQTCWSSTKHWMYYLFLPRYSLQIVHLVLSKIILSFKIKQNNAKQNKFQSFLLQVFVFTLYAIYLHAFSFLDLQVGSVLTKKYTLISSKINYLFNKCLSPLNFRVWTLSIVRCTQYNIMW